MEYKNLIPIFKKVKPSLNFNEHDIFKRKINQRKKDINISLFKLFIQRKNKNLNNKNMISNKKINNKT